MKSRSNILYASIMCFFTFLLIYSTTARSNLHATDEVAVFATGISWVTDGSLEIDELQWIQNVVNIGDIGRGGHLYSKYFPGNVFSSALIYKLAQRQSDKPYTWEAKDLNPTIGPVKLAPSNTGARLAMMLNAILGALAMTSLLLVLIHFFDWKTAIITVLLIGVCTNWWYESRGFFSEVGAGALLITSLCFMVYRRPYLSAFALGVSILFRPTNLIGIIIWFKSVFDKGLKTFWSGIFIVTSLLILLFYNWIRFNQIFNFGYGNENFESNIFIGIAGTLFSPGRSFFLYSPILCLAIPGFWMFKKREKSLSAIIAMIILAYVATISSWHAWDGGWSWGGRLLTPIIPLLGLFIAPTLESTWHKKRELLLILLLAILGFGIQLLALSSDPVMNLVDSVVYGNVNYGDTIFTIKDSWIAIQLRSLEQWNFCKLDAYILRQWSGKCL